MSNKDLDCTTLSLRRTECTHPIEGEYVEGERATLRNIFDRIFASDAAMIYHIDSPSGFLMGRETKRMGALRRKTQPDLVVRNWGNSITAIAEAYHRTVLPKWQAELQMLAMMREIAALKQRVAELEAKRPILVQIDTLSPEPYEIIKPFHIAISQYLDEYIASFMDAQLHASGETVDEAYANFKDIAVATFEMLQAHDENELGPVPLQQLRVLKSFIRKAEQT